VTLSRGFWIGKFEVTQSEYLSVMNTNPSQFPGDLSRPVSSVSWLDATNYCAKLTERERAAGRIPAGSQYRLPTEAEWECAARAGTSTRFSYGDDPDYADLTNYAWRSIDDGLTVHPVGQKLPDPWGLYDMMGNVFEWCQDWLGPLPGGAVVDPTGPDSNPIGWKIMRVGAFDFGGPACRSASRMFFWTFAVERAGWRQRRQFIPAWGNAPGTGARSRAVKRQRRDSSIHRYGALAYATGLISPTRNVHQIQWCTYVTTRGTPPGTFLSDGAPLGCRYNVTGYPVG